MDVFIEIAAIILITFFIASIVRMLKQPLIIGYIIAGIIAGPYFLDVITSASILETMSQIGIALLLFIVGINLNPKAIKETGKISILTGVGQVLFTSIAGFFICQALGFSVTASIYMAVALTFSSTIIIMKLLTDKGDLETLYGRISVGFLIVQDLIAAVILMVIPSISDTANLGSVLIETLLKGAGLIIVVAYIGWAFMPKITELVARSQEYLLLFSISWVLVISALFYYMNFSVEIGALMAGMTLSVSRYRFEISSKLRSLRDFFIILFFITLGSQMIIEDVALYILPIVVLSVFILIGNPLIVLFIMGRAGYTKRNAFLAGLTVAQISEFSLILVALGLTHGHLSTEVLSIVTTVGLITIAGSTYMIMYSHKIYPAISKYLTIFEKKGKKKDEHAYHGEKGYDIILFGYNRTGYDLLESFKKMKKKFLVVDYDPDTVVNLAKQGIDSRYGDVQDIELLNELDFKKAKLIVSTIPDFETNSILLTKLKEDNAKAISIVVATQDDEAIDLYEQGATYVLMPHFVGGQHTSSLIEKHGFNMKKFLKESLKHKESIKQRKTTKE